MSAGGLYVLLLLEGFQLPMHMYAPHVMFHGSSAGRLAAMRRAPTTLRHPLPRPQ